MSDIPVQQTLGKQLAGRWQIPLLLVSLAAVAVGVWRLRPTPKPPSFQQVYTHAVTLKELALHSEASEFIQQQLAVPERKPEELRRLHDLMAQVIYAHEVNNAVHSDTNIRRILEHTDKAVAAGELHDARTHEMRGKAFEWMKKPDEALAEYQHAVAKGGDTERAWELRKRIIEIQRTMNQLKPEDLHRAFDDFLSDTALS